VSRYLAVVKYRADATDEEKIRELRDGLGFVAMELVDLGCSIDSVEGWLEEAAMSAQDEADSMASGGASS
jgi:hypothetical protein